MAVFDVVVNNADRKGGHVLPLPGGGIRGVDHGLCFNVDDKLRTVLWGWAGRARRRTRSAMVLPAARGPRRQVSARRWRALVSPSEVRATGARIDRLLSRGRCPAADGLARDPVAAVLSHVPRISASPAMRRRGTSPRLGSPCVPGPSPRSPCSGQGPALHLFDTLDAGPARDRLRGRRRGCTSAASRRTTPPTSGHAATYVAFDLLQPGLARRRATRCATCRTSPTSTTRCWSAPAATARTGRRWPSARPTLFREDMAALRPARPRRVRRRRRGDPARRRPAIEALLRRAARPTTSTATSTSPCTPTRASARCPGWTTPTMLALFAERGGDPDRPGKRHPLDCLLWRAERPGRAGVGQPRSGRGRPGWHIECTAIALEHLGHGFDVQGGGTDLVFPHHEMSASQAHVLTGEWPFARAYVHAGMVGLDGEKMSKSQGQPGVRLGAARATACDPMAIRLALLAHHYRSDWEWTGADLAAGAGAARRRGADACRPAGRSDAADGVLDGVRGAIWPTTSTPRARCRRRRWADEQRCGGGDEPARRAPRRPARHRSRA